MGNKNYHYFVEGEDEKKLLSVLKTDMQLILPGKIEHFNIIQEKNYQTSSYDYKKWYNYCFSF